MWYFYISTLYIMIKLVLIFNIVNITISDLCVVIIIIIYGVYCETPVDVNS